MPGLGQKSERTRVLQLIREGVRPEVVAQSQDVPLEKVREYMHGKPRKPLRRPPRSPRRQRSVSPASKAQRAKVKGARSILSGEEPCDPAHLWPRSLGGCDDPNCVVPITRAEHRAYDQGELDLLPALLAHGCIAELQHALGHARGDLIGLLNHVTGEKFEPRREENE